MSYKVPPIGMLRTSRVGFIQPHMPRAPSPLLLGLDLPGSSLPGGVPGTTSLLTSPVLMREASIVKAPALAPAITTLVQPRAYTRAGTLSTPSGHPNVAPPPPPTPDGEYMIDNGYTAPPEPPPPTSRGLPRWAIPVGVGALVLVIALAARRRRMAQNRRRRR